MAMMVSFSHQLFFMYLYNESLKRAERKSLGAAEDLQKINLSAYKTIKGAEELSFSRPYKGFIIRPLRRGDISLQYVKLLQQLSNSPVEDVESLKNQFDRMYAVNKASKTYYVVAIEDVDKKTVIGVGTLFIELKFNRGGVKKGAIEDIVVCEEYRGRQFGKILMAGLIELGKLHGCYKISLNCTDEVIPFYQSIGFVAEPGNANFLVMRVAQQTEEKDDNNNSQ